jgi:hypothetical protein
LVASIVHDFWVIDSGATDHITNKLTNLCNFEGFSSPMCLLPMEKMSLSRVKEKLNYCPIV